MSNEIHVNDIGTIFLVTIKEATVAQDVSSATTKQLLFKNPSGTVLTKTAVFNTNGTDGKIKYTTVSGDLSIWGSWQLQAYIVLPTGEWHTDVVNFEVYKNVE